MVAVVAIVVLSHLVCKVANVVVCNFLRLQQLKQVRLHQLLHNVHILEVFKCRALENVKHSDYLIERGSGRGDHEYQRVRSC